MGSVNRNCATDVHIKVCQIAMGLVKQLSEINSSSSNDTVDVSGISYFHRDNNIILRPTTYCVRCRLSGQ